MRKLIIKLFVLDYVIKLKTNLYISIPRASFIIMPLMIINGVYSLYHFPIYSTPLGKVLLGLLALSLLTSFVYLNLFPASWKELDKEQKIQVAKGIESGMVKDTLTPEERVEMYEILKEFYKTNDGM